MAGGLNLSDKVAPHRYRRPEIRTQIAKVEGVGLSNLLGENLAGPANVAWIDRALRQRSGRAPLQFIRIQTHEGDIHSRLDDVAARENPDLSLFCVRCRSKRHLAPPHHDHGRRSRGNFRDEDRRGRKLQFEILGDDREA